MGCVNRIDIDHPIRYTSRAPEKGLFVQKPNLTPVQADTVSSERRRIERKGQIVGITAGIGAGILLLAVFPFFQTNPGTVETILWSAAIGGLIASFASFERAGAALTRSSNRALNLIVSLGIIALFFLVIILIFR